MKRYFLCSLFFILCSFCFCDDFNNLFNSKISSDEIQCLKNGELLIRNLGNRKKISINPITPNLETMMSSLKDQNPNYLAEIIRVLPIETNRDALTVIINALQDIESFTKIPYWSERQQNWYDLYQSSELNSISSNNRITNMNFTVQMVPFGFINMDAVLDKTDNGFLYSMVNTNSVKYDYQNITCINKGKMYCGITVFEYGDYYVFYGTGSLNALSIFFLKDRIDTAFIGRIKSFCKYMFELTEQK